MEVTYNKDKVLYTFYSRLDTKCIIMQAPDGTFIARWNVEGDDFTEEFSTLEKAMKWLMNEDLIAEEVEEEE